MKIDDLAEALSIAQHSRCEGDESEGFDVNEGVMFLGTKTPETMPPADVQRMRDLRWIWDGRYRCWAKCL